MKFIAAGQKSVTTITVSRPRVIALSLFLLTLLAYLPVASFDFVNFDDQTYVTENTIVQNGLTGEGVKWAFTTGHGGNWHPLTWISHMMDCGLFRLHPGAHHFTNALFHAVNAALLFILLLRLTNALWPAAFIAALFAWHPLHVESVAWISERKDVLSTFFALLSLLAYVRYVKENHKTSFWLSWICFVLGLMAKPMVITLPLVLLLLDYWPLQRLPDFKFSSQMFMRLLVEKWPFLLLLPVFCVVTLLAQHHAIASLEVTPLHYRIGHVLVAYAAYLGKVFWPVNLAIFYPLRNEPVWLQIGAGFLLAIISLVTWKTRRTAPYFIIGWLWFLITLIPVIGLVQVGAAAWADRYSYFPSVGIFIAVTFGALDWVARWPLLKPCLRGFAVLFCATSLIATEIQLRYWQNSETLFRHALTATGNDNDTAHNNLGSALESRGQYQEALSNYLEAIRITPDGAAAQYNLGNVLLKLGRPQDALPPARAAIRSSPQTAYMHTSLGNILTELGQFPEATEQFNLASQLDPADPMPVLGQGRALLKQGKTAEALEKYREALRLAPNNAEILSQTALVLAADPDSTIRNGPTAVILATKANVLNSGQQPSTLDILGMAYAECGDFTNAQTAVEQAYALAKAANMKNLEPLQRRLQLYQNHQPWRQSLVVTNVSSNTVKP